MLVSRLAQIPTLATIDIDLSLITSHVGGRQGDSSSRTGWLTVEVF